MTVNLTVLLALMESLKRLQGLGQSGAGQGSNWKGLGMCN